MNGKICLTALIFGGVVCAALASEVEDSSRSTGSASAARAGSKPGMRLILMSNGQVRPGEVEEVKDGYVIKRASARMTLPKEQVLFVGDTLEDLYQFKVSQFPPNDIGEQRNLINWCRQNGLDSKVEIALEQILKADSNNAYANAMLKDRHKKRARAEEMAMSGEVAKVTPRPIDYKEFLKSIEEGCGSDCLKHYNRLEIHLLRSCANAGCHGNIKYDKGFQLFQRADTRMTPAKMTGRNLFSLTQSINIDDPNNSIVLVKALQGLGHANLSSPPFAGVSDARYRELRDWVFTYAGKQGSKALLAHSVQPQKETPPRTKRDGFGSDRAGGGQKYSDTGPASIPVTRPGDDIDLSRPGMKGAADDAPAAPSKKPNTKKGKGPAEPGLSTKDPFDPTNDSTGAEDGAQEPPHDVAAPANTAKSSKPTRGNYDKPKKNKNEKAKDPFSNVRLPGETSKGDPFEAAPFAFGVDKQRGRLETSAPGMNVKNERKSVGRDAHTNNKKKEDETKEAKETTKESMEDGGRN